MPGSRLLFFEQREANQRVAERLQIDKGAPVLAIKRLRTVSDLPFCVETSCLPVELFRGIAPVQQQDAEPLGLKRGEAALVIHVIASDARSMPIEYMTSINHPRRVMLTTEQIAR